MILPQRAQTTSVSEEKNVSGLKNHEKQDKIPLCMLAFSANGFKAMKAQDKQIKRRGCCVTVFWLYSPERFELDPLSCSRGFRQPGFSSSRFSVHTLVRATQVVHMTAILTQQKDKRREEKNPTCLPFVSNESYLRKEQMHTQESLEV